MSYLCWARSPEAIYTHGILSAWKSLYELGWGWGLAALVALDPTFQAGCPGGWTLGRNLQQSCAGGLDVGPSHEKQDPQLVVPPYLKPVCGVHFSRASAEA